MLRKILKFRKRKRPEQKIKRLKRKLVSSHGRVHVTRVDGFINWVSPELAKAA